MRNYIYILCFVLLLAGCSKDEPADMFYEENVSLVLEFPGMSPWTKVVDQDNLAVEQTIKNIAVFFTLPGSNTISHKYINAAYTAVDDFKVVNVPLNPSELQRRDIYVVTNFDNASLNSVSTITDLEAKTTPVVGKNSNLDPSKGFCMYGKTLDFNFATATFPAKVYVEKTVTKLRLSLSFPSNPNASTNNTFVIGKAATYTYVVGGTGQSIPSSAYFNFASRIALQSDGNGNYTSTTYVYEAEKVPELYVYTRMNNKDQIFTADLPIPKRNYLYDIYIEVYESSAKSFSDSGEFYMTRTTVTEYDAEGGIVSEYIM